MLEVNWPDTDIFERNDIYGGTNFDKDDLWIFIEKNVPKELNEHQIFFKHSEDNNNFLIKKSEFLR